MKKGYGKGMKAEGKGKRELSEIREDRNCGRQGIKNVRGTG